MSEAARRAANRANWDARVPVHLAATAMYDLAPLRAGRGMLDPIAEAELGGVAGLRVLHLQCHFGRDSLTLAQRGADVTGLDFSAAAIVAARDLAAELDLPARFVEADLYAARTAIPEPASFDRVFVTWGALCWLSDIAEWARIVAYFLKPGGSLYLADDHPVAAVFDDEAGRDGMPFWATPYFTAGAQQYDCASTYADRDARLAHTRTFQWLHTLGDVLNALLAAGLRLDWLHEHAALPWQRFTVLRRDADGMYRWPDRAWLPLAFSLRARRGPG